MMMGLGQWNRIANKNQMHRSRKGRKKHTRQVRSTTKGKNLDQTSKDRRTKRNFRKRIEPEEEDEEDRANCTKPELAQTTHKQLFVAELLRHQNLNRRPPQNHTTTILARSTRAPF
jgi:hypothetical protein